MQIGDAVRARVSGTRRLLRGRVEEVRDDLVRVSTGLQSAWISRHQVTVIRRQRERDVVLANVQAIRDEAKHLASALRGKRGHI